MFTVEVVDGGEGVGEVEAGVVLRKPTVRLGREESLQVAVPVSVSVGVDVSVSVNGWRTGWAESSLCRSPYLP